MSTGQLSRHRSRSSTSKQSAKARPTPPPQTLTPENTERALEPCAATGSFFLYAQRNVVLCLHHDTLAIERRFDRHREDVQWISVDTVSEKGAGRLVVSYDIGQTAIVWDILTGDEVARFAAYEHIQVASWMRNGNIAFGRLGSFTLVSLICADQVQETLKETLFCLSHRPPSTYRRGPSSTRSLQ